MTLPFDAYQTVMLLLAGVAALAGYFHTRYQGIENAKELASQEGELSALDAKVRALEVAHAGHTSSLDEIVKNLRSVIVELQQELRGQREVTLQLERTVARLSASTPA